MYPTLVWEAGFTQPAWLLSGFWDRTVGKSLLAASLTSDLCEDAETGSCAASDIPSLEQQAGHISSADTSNLFADFLDSVCADGSDRSSQSCCSPDHLQTNDTTLESRQNRSHDRG